SATNPSFSLSLPGPAPIGVPNFFIDSFRIPPFLLPIYQAAGIQYNVPWQVLAAINEIETDYGRNLSVSSAGAVGWMQFLPSTWKTWGVDANGDGVADPYNPVDAIFTAARYLHAAGASQNLSGAIFAYNHATWYVQSVLLRAKLIGGTQTLGRYLELQDATGNIYTYAQLGSVVKSYPVPKPVKLTAADVARELSAPRTSGSPRAPATAGSQQTPSGTAAPATTSVGQAPAPSAKSTKGAPITLPVMSPAASKAQTTPAPMVK